MTLDEAKSEIGRGAFYGDVWPLVPEAERGALAEWFVRDPELPAVIEGRRVRAAAPPSPTGELCTRCGGFLVRTGSCMTCQGCGQSSGGCG